ncbi:hypothetical protein H5R92_01350 [Limosilactobacillus sp. BG-MG3-A]|uniref:Uncharacterized protein n=1 Tax=Limosilactobacillus agrestis TaxID=2759748 RepID=A0A7W3UG72_9LACO|nr:hypothetical protein [Limosilactobacillus agrestis]MBB1094866.1 hypothetical protein [Limosilactobacillus agrestis]
MNKKQVGHLKSIKINKILFALTIIIILLSFVLDKKNIPISKWNLNVTYWTGIISAATTIMGVYLTFQYEKSRSKEQDKKNNLPVLVYSIELSVYPFREKQRKRKTILDYKLISTKEDKRGIHNLLIPIKVENIGVGIAVIKDVYCINRNKKTCYKGNNSDTSPTKLINKNDNSIFCIEIFGIEKEDINNLSVNIEFYDIFQNRYEDVFYITKSYDEISVKEDWKRYVEYEKNKVDYNEASLENDLELELNYIKKGGLIARNLILYKSYLLDKMS